MDTTPIALHAMGLPVPTYVEGRVPPGLFDAAWLAAHPVRRVERDAQAAPAPAADAGYSAEDEAAVTERLKELGYL
jgi:hypothetical protein